MCRDLQRSLAFYEGLGFEKRLDVPWGDGHRWIEVYPPGAPTGFALVPPGPGDPVGIHTGIILDKCSRCGGIWLDAGELDRVQMTIEAWDQTLGQDIKRRSPFRYTYVAELANDWIGYLPDRKGHELGGYQTWTGLHSFAEPGTGERIADVAVGLLEKLAKE